MAGWLRRRHLHYSALLSGPSPATNFYGNSHIFRYAAMDSVAFSLRQLIFFGKMLGALGMHDHQEVEQRLVRGANFIRIQLPIRIARRIRDFQSLPFIVASNPHLTDALNLYVEAFEKMRSYPPIYNQADNQKWCEFVEKLLNEHRVVIPQLAIGIAESSRYLTAHQIDSFMTCMLQSRISRRVLAQHHISLTAQFQDKKRDTSSMRFIGIVDTKLQVSDVIQNCIRLAKFKLRVSNPAELDSVLDVRMTGKKDVTFAYIPDQLEYIMFELLLNSFRATLRHARKLSRPPADFPIHIHIVSSSTHITIRLSDHAGGIRPAFIPSLTDEDDFPPSVSRRELFSFSHLDEGPLPLKGLIKNGGLAGTVGEQVGDEKSGGALIEGDDVVEARLRIGLPLSAIFAQFFGGSLSMYSIEGSADAVLCIPKLGTTTEPTSK